MRALVCMLCLLVARAGFAGNDRPRVAVLEVAIGGDAPPGLRVHVEKSLAGGLYAAGFEVVRSDEVAAKLRRARTLVGCTSTTCLSRIGDLVGARRFVRARVVASREAYELELELLAADAEGGLVQRIERPCPVCTLREVNDLVSRSVVELMSPPRREAPRPVPVAVTTRPDGAAVSVDGSLLGRAPTEVELEPGEHTFRATLPEGYRPVERRQTIGGERGDVLLELEPIAPAAPPMVVATRSRRFGAWKWAAAGGAAALLGTGVALLAIDGKRTSCHSGQPCKDQYDTLAAGLGLAGAGVAMGAVATWMFVTDMPAAVVPTEGGVAVVVGGKF